MAELFDSAQTAVSDPAPETETEPTTEPAEETEPTEPAEPEPEPTEPTEPEPTEPAELTEPTEPEPKKPDIEPPPAKPPAAVVDPMDDWRRRWSDVDGRYQMMKAKIGQKKLDPISDADQYAEYIELLEARQNLSIERQEIADSRVAQTTAQIERDRYWSAGGGFAQTYPGVNPDEGRKLWESTVAEIVKEYPGVDDNAMRLAATVAFKSKLASKKTEPRKTGPAITDGGGRVVPKGVSTKPPAPKALSAADEILRKFGPPEKVL
jgi:hypothetical protein